MASLCFLLLSPQLMRLTVHSIDNPRCDTPCPWHGLRAAQRRWLSHHRLRPCATSRPLPTRRWTPTGLWSKTYGHRAQETLSYEVTGLIGGTQYDVQVRSVSGAGDGQWSADDRGCTPLLDGTACATGTGQCARPEQQPLLWWPTATHCSQYETLLPGDGTLNWSANTSMDNWDGVDSQRNASTRYSPVPR